MKRTSKTIALSTVAVGIVVLVAAGFAAKDWIREEWYLLDLETYDAVRSKKAAEWLGEHGSLRAMQRLADLVRKLSRFPDAEDGSSGTCNALVRIAQALEAIAVKRRTDVVPVLVTLLNDKPPNPPPGNEVRIGAANFLGKIGRDARDAIPALREALNDDEERFRRYVAEALERIQGTQDETERYLPSAARSKAE